MVASNDNVIWSQCTYVLRLTSEPINWLLLELVQTLFQQSLRHLLTSYFFKTKNICFLRHYRVPVWLDAGRYVCLLSQ